MKSMKNIILSISNFPNFSLRYLTLILLDVASSVSGFNNCSRTLITRGGCLSEKLIDTPITVAHSTAWKTEKKASEYNLTKNHLHQLSHIYSTVKFFHQCHTFSSLSLH